jgi:hypothetical protein
MPSSSNVVRPLHASLAALAPRALLPVYTATIFVSAFLLFAVQPMFTKMVTPTLGGTPGVWSVAVVFFQAILLAGYAYAHLLTTRLTPAKAAGVHLTLVAAVALAALPIGFDPSWGRPPETGPAFWLIAVFAVSVGLPFFAVSANGPLLQAWFARTSHAQAHDPYFLYGASNLASFAALLAYPFLFEPWLPLAAQSRVWSLGFAILLAGLGASAVTMLLSPGRAAATMRADETAPAAITARDRFAWIGLSFVPSALLVAVTAHLSTDIATVPLLWILPLALFLLTFVIALRANNARAVTLSLAAQPLAAVLVMMTPLHGVLPIAGIVVARLAFLLISTIICHAELYRRRPAASQLSSFYMLMSLGGALGGIFASLLAPFLFNSVLEYPILLVAALVCRPRALAELKALGAVKLAAVVAGLAAVFAVLSMDGVPDFLPIFVVGIAGLILSCVMLLARETPGRLVILMAFGLVVVKALLWGGTTIAQERSFFAVHNVRYGQEGRAHLLVYGSTMHGAEWVRDAAGKPLTERPVSASYFHAGGVYQQAIGAVRGAAGGKLGRVAVIGLGMGSLACSAAPGEDWSFYEIDPVVVKLARDRRLFRSLSVCTPDAKVVIGDGRLTIADAKEKYDLIILDAFSSDSVPVHLLTKEAVALYKSKLTAAGAIIFNISNRHMALEAVIAGSAQPHGLAAAYNRDSADVADTVKLAARATVAIAAPPAGPIVGELLSRGWKPAEADTSPWTDDYSNIMAPMLRKRRQQAE